MNQQKAVSPSSISFVFKVCRNNHGKILGSIGVGATVDTNVTVTSKPALRTRIVFNGKPISFPTVETVIKKLTKKSVDVAIESKLPLACGFGISGASSIATAYSINHLFHLEKDKQILARVAHDAEIENRTGLGSVATEITGGFLVKQGPGIPVSAKRLPFTGKKLYAIVLKPYETSKILGDEKRSVMINTAAERALDKINALSIPTLSTILDISYSYAKESGILQKGELQSMIEDVRNQGGHATMAMVGETMFSDSPPKSFSNKNYVLTISDTIAKVI